uniref:Secreted protein n=1 Tax=Panagrellus redivivus TaxID=6233 RepID=A0A7E4W7A3_PANRE
MPFLTLILVCNIIVNPGEIIDRYYLPFSVNCKTLHICVITSFSFVFQTVLSNKFITVVLFTLYLLTLTLRDVNQNSPIHDST